MKDKFRYTGTTLATATVDSQDLVFGPGAELEVDPKNEYIAALIEKGILVRVRPAEPESPPTTKSPGPRRASSPAAGPPSKSKSPKSKPSKES